MNPTITKLKQSYERLQASFTMQNKLDFDQVVWSCLPELWTSEVSTAKPKVGSKGQTGKSRMVKNYVNGLTTPTSTNDVLRHFESIGVSVSRDTVARVLASDPRAKRVLAGDVDAEKYLDASCKAAMWVLFPNESAIERPSKPKKYIRSTPTKKTPPKPIKPSVNTPFIEWFESNYELADGFTPIFDLIKQCPHIISEDRAKDQLKSKGYLVYNRPAGGCVQARPIKKQKSEFVNLTEVLKEMK